MGVATVAGLLYVDYLNRTKELRRFAEHKHSYEDKYMMNPTNRAIRRTSEPDETIVLPLF